MISDHEHLALRHPRIVEFCKLHSEYHVRFDAGAERLKVVFRVFETGDARFFFEQSHFIKTPLQDRVLEKTRVTHESSHGALARGVESITTFYDDAVEQGHLPSIDWFVENDLF